MTDRPDIVERLQQRSSVDPESGCWIWLLHRDKDGYGRIGHKRELAHRVSYRAFIGELPKGQCVLHACDNPACINPQHLRAGTQRDNITDMLAKGRQNLSGLRAGQSADVLERIAKTATRVNGRFAKKADAAIAATKEQQA